MFQKNSATKQLITIAALILFIPACAHQEPNIETMRICDASGCNDRPKNYASFNPANNPTPEDEKILALEKLAANDPRAAYDLALRLFRGDGVQQDSYRSIQWMRAAAEKGDFDAQKALGRLYLTGLGEMGADYGEAQKWLSITASKGDQEAAQLLTEATVARKSELEEYRWNNQWQPTFYNYWYSQYPYRWYWQNQNWNLY
jgi:TPR repeat protein